MMRPAPAGGDGALLLAAGGFPDGGFDQPAAVQRQAGKHVEDADQQVGPDEDVGQDVGHAGQVAVGQQEPAAAGQDEVRGRAGHGHEDGAARGGGEALELGVAAPEVQDDLLAWASGRSWRSARGRARAPARRSAAARRRRRRRSRRAMPSAGLLCCSTGPVDDHGERRDDEPGVGQEHGDAGDAAQRDALLAAWRCPCAAGPAAAVSVTGAAPVRAAPAFPAPKVAVREFVPQGHELFEVGDGAALEGVPGGPAGIVRAAARCAEWRRSRRRRRRRRRRPARSLPAPRSGARSVPGPAACSSSTAVR